MRVNVGAKRSLANLLTSGFECLKLQPNMDCHDLPPLVVHDFLAAIGRVPPMKNRIQIKLLLRLIEIIHSDLNLPTITEGRNSTITVNMILLIVPLSKLIPSPASVRGQNVTVSINKRDY